MIDLHRDRGMGGRVVLNIGIDGPMLGPLGANDPIAFQLNELYLHRWGREKQNQKIRRTGHMNKVDV